MPAIAAWRAAPSAETAAELHRASEPRRLELFRRLNLAPGGTAALVRMREQLLDAHRSSRRSRHRRQGFRPPVLVLVQPGVPGAAPHRLVDARRDPGKDHPLRGGARNSRLGGFAPARRSAGPPLLRLLSSGAGRRAADLRRSGADPRDTGRDRADPVRQARAGRAAARHHRGVLFDHQLPARACRRHLRPLPDQAGGRGSEPRTAAHRHFVTLSPAPNFAAWLNRERINEASLALDEDDRETLSALRSRIGGAMPGSPPRCASRSCARPPGIIVRARNGRGLPADSVARFHLGNGARLERLNWLGDTRAARWRSLTA